MSPDTPDEFEKPIRLAAYAELIGKSTRTVERYAAKGRIPVWIDPVTGGRMTSLSAIGLVQRLAAEKAQAEYIQRKRLGR